MYDGLFLVCSNLWLAGSDRNQLITIKSEHTVIWCPVVKSSVFTIKALRAICQGTHNSLLRLAWLGSRNPNFYNMIVLLDLAISPTKQASFSYHQHFNICTALLAWWLEL